MNSRVKAVVMPAMAILLSAQLTAQIQKNVQIHGFGGWAAGHTSNENSFGSVANRETPTSNYYFTLNLSTQLERNVTIFAQPSWQSNLSGNEVVLDYAFGQWMLLKQFGLRVGKIKNPVGIYSEVLNVGTLRPFYLAPPGRYLGALQAYTGIGFTGIIGMGPLEFVYDLFGGSQKYDGIIIEQAIGVDPVTRIPIFLSFHLSPEGRDLIGGRFVLQSPISGFKVGVSATSSNLYYSLEGGPVIKTGNRRSSTVGGQAEYNTGRFLARAEYWGLDDPNSKVKNGFAETAYKITSHWQAAVEYDWVKFKVFSVSEALNNHKSLGLALNYWVTPEFVFKLNHYWVKGNNLAKPVNSAQTAALGTLKERTNALIFGMQFSF
jgi:hypothetical protein